MFDAGWIAFMLEAVDRAMAAPGRHGEEYARSGGRFFGDLDLWQRHEPFRRFVFDSPAARSEEHTSELQSLMRISYAVFCLKKKNILTELNKIKIYTKRRTHDNDAH